MYMCNRGGEEEKWAGWLAGWLHVGQEFCQKKKDEEINKYVENIILCMFLRATPVATIEVSNRSNDPFTRGAERVCIPQHPTGNFFLIEPLRAKPHKQYDFLYEVVYDEYCFCCCLKTHNGWVPKIQWLG